MKYHRTSRLHLPALEVFLTFCRTGNQDLISSVAQEIPLMASTMLDDVHEHQFGLDCSFDPGPHKAHEYLASIVDNLEQQLLEHVHRHFIVERSAPPLDCCCRSFPPMNLDSHLIQACTTLPGASTLESLCLGQIAQHVCASSCDCILLFLHCAMHSNSVMWCVSCY
eukprot:m.129131 g.129131  ORF g.129131 m.129131 type:complete len:167 (-) comp13884_c0_seq8:128-628(-)